MANLKELFPEFYQEDLKVSDLSNQTDNLIVLDTNYLLDIIQLPTTVSKKYIEALENIKENIYIPYLVALEFNFKKSSIKKEKIKKIKKYKDTIENSVSKIKDNIESIDLVDKNEKEEFTNEILTLTEIYSDNLKTLVEKKIVSIITKEEVELYERLIQIIEEKIGNKYTQQWIDSVEKEGEKRFENKIPPGFNDISKDEEEDAVRQYGDIKYQRKYGDLLIWKDIIEYSKECNKSGKKVFFITNDGKSKRKNDLLYKVNDQIVGPNIHLMNELQVEANKEFHILNNLRFVQLVNDLSDAEMNELKSSSEQLLNIKLPYKLSEVERAFLKEVNFNKDEVDYELLKKYEDYLLNRGILHDDTNYIIENEARKEYIIRNLRNKLMHETYGENTDDIMNLQKRRGLTPDEFEALLNRKSFSGKTNYLDKLLSNDVSRKDSSKLFENYTDNKYSTDPFE